MGRNHRSVLCACSNGGYPVNKINKTTPALKISLTLDSEGYKLLSVEPNILSHDKLSIVSLKKAIEQADVIAVLVKHKEFVNSSLLKNITGKSILDFCGALE